MNLNNLTQENFELWLEQQPEDREFDYSDCRDCLIASFLKEAGVVTDPRCTHYAFRHGTLGEACAFPGWLCVVDTVACDFVPTIFDVNEFRNALRDYRRIKERSL